MNLLIAFLIGIGLAILVCIIIKLTTRVEDEDDFDIISQGNNRASKFGDCCVKPLKRLFRW